MELNSFMEKYATEIGGQYSEYNNDISIIIVPIPDGRFQTVYGTRIHENRYNKELIEFRSKVCELDTQVNMESLLRENTNFCHGKFSIVGDEVQVEASLLIESATEETLKEALQEVANVADEFELKLTGADIY